MNTSRLDNRSNQVTSHIRIQLSIITSVIFLSIWPVLIYLGLYLVCRDIVLSI
jgi:hypothetical protein